MSDTLNLANAIRNRRFKLLPQLTLSGSIKSVSYLSIKSPKSLTNKDFTNKSLFLKDLETTNR